MTLQTTKLELRFAASKAGEGLIVPLDKQNAAQPSAKLGEGQPRGTLKPVFELPTALRPAGAPTPAPTSY